MTDFISNIENYKSKTSWRDALPIVNVEVIDQKIDGYDTMWKDIKPLIDEFSSRKEGTDNEYIKSVFDSAINQALHIIGKHYQDIVATIFCSLTENLEIYNIYSYITHKHNYHDFNSILNNMIGNSEALKYTKIKSAGYKLKAEIKKYTVISGNTINLCFGTWNGIFSIYTQETLKGVLFNYSENNGLNYDSFLMWSSIRANAKYTIATKDELPAITIKMYKKDKTIDLYFSSEDLLNKFMTDYIY